MAGLLCISLVLGKMEVSSERQEVRNQMLQNRLYRAERVFSLIAAQFRRNACCNLVRTAAVLECGPSLFLIHLKKA